MSLFKIACAGWPLASSVQMTPPSADASYEVARQGISLGSFTLRELADLLESGKLAWNDDCWTEGMESWRKLDEMRTEIEAAVPAKASSIDGYLLPVGAVVGLAIAVGLGYLLLSGGDDRHASAEPAGAIAPGALSARDKATHLSLGEVQDQITAMTAGDFITKRDPRTGELSYAHRFYENVGNRIPLRAHVTADGRCHLYTYYRGTEWLLHRQLRLTINRQALVSEKIPAHRCRREIGEDNTIFESCHFPGESDHKLVVRLASAQGATVQMQLLGRRISEITLSFETMQAIKDSQALAELLARRQRLLEALSSSP